MVSVLRGQCHSDKCRFGHFSGVFSLISSWHFCLNWLLYPHCGMSSRKFVLLKFYSKSGLKSLEGDINKIWANYNEIWIHPICYLSIVYLSSICLCLWLRLCTYSFLICLQSVYLSFIYNTAIIYLAICLCLPIYHLSISQEGLLYTLHLPASAPDS